MLVVLCCVVPTQMHGYRICLCLQKRMTLDGLESYCRRLQWWIALTVTATYYQYLSSPILSCPFTLGSIDGLNWNVTLWSVFAG